MIDLVREFGLEQVVDLAGVTVQEAYAWGWESGAFHQHAMRKVAQNGHWMFREQNLGMIIMIAAEYGYEVEVMRVADGQAICKVTRA